MRPSLKTNGKSVHTLRSAILMVFLCMAKPLAAGALEYRYDDVGRVVESINATTGQVTIYTYDAAGNISEIRNVALSTVAIAGFSPLRGPVGAAVTITGSGFSTTPSANTVRFNGQQATVTSATSTKLTVTVPAGATTGRVTVTTSAGTDTSRSDFTVTSVGGPTISSFSPSSGAAGATVTITGTNYWPNISENRVLFNQTNARIAAVTGSTSLTVQVPAGASSGKIRVSTPAGIATSASAFLVPPSGKAVTDIVAGPSMTVNGNSAIVVPGGKTSLQLFEGSAGQYLTVGITSNTITSATLKLIAPDGATLLSSTVTPSTPAVQFPRLPQTGTYTISVDPGAYSGSMTLTLYGPVAGTLTGSDQTFSVSQAGRRILLTYSGNAQTWASLAMKNVNLASTVTVFDSNGNVLMSRTATTGTLEPYIANTGTYTVLIDPSGAITGSLTLSMAARTVYNGYLWWKNYPDFEFWTGVRAGEYPTFVVKGTSETGPDYLTVSVYGPTGQLVATRGIPIDVAVLPSDHIGSTVFDFGSLPAGSYRLYTTRESGVTNERLLVEYWFPEPVEVSPTINSQTFDVAIGTRGQPVRMRFFANAGQAVSLTTSTYRQSIKDATIKILSPTGELVASGTLTGVEYFSGCPGACTSTLTYSDTETVTTSALTASGTYTAIIVPTLAKAGTYSFTLTATNDKEPVAYSFIDKTGVLLNSVQTSNTITVSGLSSGTTAPISVIGGLVSINGGAFAPMSPGTTISVSNGTTLAVQHTASGEFLVSRSTTLYVGSKSDTFTTTTGPQDDAPDAFAFTDQKFVVRNTTQSSNEIILGGLHSKGAPISITGGSYSKNGGAFTSAPGTAVLGDRIRVQHTSASARSTSVSTTLTIGGVSDTYTTTTEPVLASFSTAAASVTEGTGAATTATVTFALSAASAETVTVPFTVSGGTANNPADHNAMGTSIVFSPGQTTAAWTFQVVADNIDEPNETVLLTMSDPAGASKVCDVMTFPSHLGVGLGGIQVSDPATITGITPTAGQPTEVPITVVNGEYSIDGGNTFFTTPGAVKAGDSVILRHYSASDFSTANTTTVIVGGVPSTFTSRTKREPDPCPTC